MRRRVSVLLDPLQTPQEARRPMYRPANRETLGDGRGREASVTPPRPPRDSSDGWAARCHVRSILTRPAQSARYTYAQPG